MRILTVLLIPWLTVFASLYAGTLLLWLGALVVFSAVRQRAAGKGQGAEGIWAGIGLLLAGIGMSAHTAMLDYPVDSLLDNIASWWKPMWIAMIAVPGGWAALALAYAGYGQPGSRVRARSRSALWLCIALGLLALGAGMATDARQIALQFASLGDSAVPPQELALCAGYAGYLILCLALSADALLRPEASGRLLRDLARRRARPYLLGATGALGLSAGTILAVFGWAAWLAFRNPSLGTVNQLNAVGDGLELAVSFFTCAAVACIGKAVASFEIFSGLALPRAAIAGSWRSTALALGLFSFATAGLLGFEGKGVYTILAAAGALAFVSAWLAARLDAAQRTLMRAPEELTGTADGAMTTLASVLDSRIELQPLGAVATLLGQMPAAETWPPETYFVAPEASGDPWIIPLRRGAEVIGALRIWPRRAGALLTEDSVTLARGAAEKILEAQAAHALSAQLIEVQRRAAHQGESLDAAIALGGRTRRALHDELLPRLHAALLELSSIPAARESSVALTEAHKMVSDILRDAPPDASEELAKYGLWTALERAANTEFERTPFQLMWAIEDAARAASPTAERQETLFHAAREALRNARRYARGEDAARVVTLRLAASAADGHLDFTIADDGVGVKARAVSQGAGQGLALHGALIAVTGGSLRISEAEQGGTRVDLRVPV